MSELQSELDPCDCCEGVAALTPGRLDNPPRQPSLSYRVGTHGTFKATMLAGLSRQPALQGFTSRAGDDPAIALIDAWATALDVLTFYQERIANEGYLRTATERRSILELARAIGYELRPAVAASTTLAFDLETAPGAPAETTIPVGTKIQSIPGPQEKPQTYETVEALVARSAWSQLRPQTAVLALPKFGDTQICLQGTTTNLKPGDVLLIVGDERLNDSGNENWDFRRVTAVRTVSATDPANSHTVVDLDRGLGSETPHVEPTHQNPKVYALRQRANLFGFNVPDWRSMPKSVKASYLGVSEGEVDLSYTEWPDFTVSGISDRSTDPAMGTGLYGEYFGTRALTQRKLVRTDPTIDFAWGSGSPAAGIGADNFSVRWMGWIRPKVDGNTTFTTLSDDGVRLWVDGSLVINNWTTHPPTENAGVAIGLKAGRKYDIKLEYFEQSGSSTIKLFWAAPGLAKEIIPAKQLYPRNIHDVHLDAIYSHLVKGSWVVLAAPGYQEVYQVERVAEDARANFAMSAKTTRLTLKGENLLEKFDEQIRETVIFGQSEELALAARPVTGPVQGDTIVLDRLVNDLPAGRTLVVTGKRMRIRVLQPVVLTASDGSIRALLVDDMLQVVSVPVLLPSGLSRWTLTDKHGFTGSVEAGDGVFELTASDPADPTVSEVAIIKEVPSKTDPTQIVLTAPLANLFDRSSVTLNANVARATHGETRREVLGSGDGSKDFQRFDLKSLPLTYVAADTPSGSTSTLEVRVNSIAWQETPSFYGHGPRDRVFVTRLADDGKTAVEFGDGVHGARVATGVENVTAVYRSGSGLEGLVKPAQLSLLLTRPLGVKGVSNALAPTGADDPETRDQARKNAPNTVLTFDRVVSLADFESFARAFGGIAKAQAASLWHQGHQTVHVTVAGASGAAVPSADPLQQRLRSALRKAGASLIAFEILSYEKLVFAVRAEVIVQAGYLAEKVLRSVRGALETVFSFDLRDLGQSVTRSEMIGVIQSIEGVETVNVTRFHISGPGKLPTLENQLVAHPGRRTADGTILPAQLVLVDPAQIEVVNVTVFGK